MNAPGTVFQLVGTGNHIRIILSLPKGDPSRVLICNFTDEDKSPTCSLRYNAGDHEWLTKKSTVALQYLTTVQFSGFATAGSGIRISASPLDPQILREIQDYILASPHVNEKFKAFLR